MVKKNDNQIEVSNSLEDIRLQYECEQAFIRRYSLEPSVREEWNKFLSQEKTIEKEKKRISIRKTKRTLWISVGMAVAAIFIGILFLPLLEEPVSTPSVSKPLFVLLEESTEHDVKIEETNEQKQSTTEYAIATESVNKQGAILSSRQADYTQVKSQAMQMKVSIPRGKTYHVILNDGTEVWLNAGSRLLFPNHFDGETRSVTLHGEAYFKVAKNEKKPFVVITDQLATYVLGTEFNVKAYEGSESHVTLVKGSVKVEIPKVQKEVLLAPGEDIACLHDGTCTVERVDTEHYIQWMAGYFYFDNVCLKDILKELGYWYNLTVEAENDMDLMDMRLHFVVERDKGIEQVIKKLNAYHYLSVTKEENTLVVCRKVNN